MDTDRSPLTLALVSQLLEIDSLERVREAITYGVSMLVVASRVRLLELDGGTLTVTAERGAADELADAVEAALLPLVYAGPSRSTLERHGVPAVDALCERYRRAGRLCQARPLRAFGRRVGTVAFHCVRRSELTPGELEALRRYGDSAGVALRNAYAREDLRRLAYTDPLTGLANRRALDDALDEHGRAPLSLLFVDFDGLKAVNEQAGYEDGDAVIAAVGTALRTLELHRALPARLGGDEFVVLLPGAGPEEAAQASHQVASALEALPVPPRAEPFYRGASVGYVVRGPGEGHVALLRRASVEMRATKTARRTPETT